MKICHVCKAECEDETELCPVCGADLTVGEEERSEEEAVINNPVLLATVDDVVSSEILKDLLKENGILFTCDSDEEGTLKVTFGGSFIADDIYVDESDFEGAAQIYGDFLNSEPEFDGEFFDGGTDGEEDSDTDLENEETENF